MAVCDLTLDVGSQPLNPETHLPLMEMVYSRQILEEKFNTAGALDFFAPEVDDSWKNDLSIHHSIRVRYKNYRNPFNNVAVTDVAYKDDESCPPVLDQACTPGCVSTENSWRFIDVKFSKNTRVGVSWCVETEKLLYQDAEQRWNESVSDAQEVHSTIGWTELVCQAIDAPADTLLPAFRGKFPTHYFDAGDADRYNTMTQVFNYMKRLYGRRWDNEFVTLADPQFELDILDVQTQLHNYDKTGIPTAQGNVDTFAAGGFRPMPALPKLWGSAILIAPDVYSYYPESGSLSGSNLNPFQNEDGSKYYVVIVSKRAYFHGAVTLMDKQYFPATCDNKYASIQQSWLHFYQLLFPNEIFVTAFNQDSVLSS